MNQCCFWVKKNNLAGIATNSPATITKPRGDGISHFSPHFFVQCSPPFHYAEDLFNIFCHNPILAKFIRSKMRTWKSLIVQASPWYVDPCSSGLDLQELKKILPMDQRGDLIEVIFSLWSPLWFVLRLKFFVAPGDPYHGCMGLLNMGKLGQSSFFMFSPLT